MHDLRKYIEEMSNIDVSNWRKGDQDNLIPK